MPSSFIHQEVVDTSCDLDTERPFLPLVLAANISVASICMKFEASRWTRKSWEIEIQNLAHLRNIKEMNPHVFTVLQELITIINRNEIIVITNGGGKEDASFLANLSRLCGKPVLLDLGPKGPAVMPTPAESVSVYLAQSQFVLTHPNVIRSGVATTVVRPIINDTIFNPSRAMENCRGSPKNNDILRILFIGRMVSQKGQDAAASS